MRTTKTLLVAAAALAATVVASKAQTVYSQNVVGYVNVTCPGNAFTLLANQLDFGPGSNNVNNVLSSGPISASAPAGYAQSVLLVWTGSGFGFLDYYNSGDASAILGPGTPGGWYNGSFVLATNNLGPSQAVFLSNPGANPITVTLTGQVDQGTNKQIAVTPGDNFYSEPAPLAGQALDSTNVNFPAISSVDTYQAWTGTGYGAFYNYYNSADASGILGPGTPGGWYDGNFNDVDSSNTIWPNVGSGFLIFHGNATSQWTNNFEVQ